MSVFSGLTKADITTASDGLLELADDRLQCIIRTDPIADYYHVEQTPFARGKFASVRKLRHLVTGEEYAAKFIRKRRRAADTSREIRHEVAVLALCAPCSRVVRLHEVYETRSEVAIVLELCAGGELQRLLDEEERLSEGATRRALRHVLEGLSHLHSQRVAHLDLKPQNLLLSAGGDELLICDFGISRAIQPGAQVREILGTRDYVAPEILSYEPLTLAADIWSVGVLAYVLLSGYSPFAGDTKQETYLNIAQCQLSFPRDLFRGVSQMAIHFIRETLIVDPKGRLTVEECLEHRWLKDDADIPYAIVGVGFSADAEADDTDSDDDNDSDDNINGEHENGIKTNGIKENGVTNGCKENGVETNSGKENGVGTNGFKENGVGTNGVKENGVGTNGVKENGVGTNGIKENGVAINGIKENGIIIKENGVTISVYENGVKENGINGHNGTCNGTNGVHDDENAPPREEERAAPLKHAHARDVSPPFPDAPSTPKVLRKSRVHPPSVLALCKKFQPDYEKPAKLPAPPPVPEECGAPADGWRVPPDRAVLC